MIFDEFTLKSQIRAVPDFPKPGVVFRDITPLFQSPRALRMTVDSFVQRYIEADFSHIGAMDARGFLIGSAVAYALNKPLVLFFEAAAIIDLPELGGSTRLQDAGISTFSLTAFALDER
ncbi:hypothetical protein [Pseudomonas aeruginosa]|uniref:hypothetical protein n=1 Tax=Pseudomonas aeruginosa TaxID=287 RepID=UPI001051BD19|nr:hypothetical protein [Pseudomonas aeruginosa]